MGLPEGPEALWGYADVAHRFHTPGMRAHRFLARSKIASGQCAMLLLYSPSLPR